MRFVSMRIATAMCGLFCFTAGVAADSSAEPFTLANAIRRSLSHHPTLNGFVFELKAQDARLAEARLPSGFQADVLIEDAAGSGERRGVSAAQTTLSLSHLIELGGKREGRVAVAEATRQRLRTEQAARQLDVVAEVARRFVVVLNGQERVRIARDGVDIARRSLSAVQLRVAAARAPDAEQIRAEVGVVESELVLEDAEHELVTARHQLAAAIGEDEVHFGTAVGELLDFPLIATFGELRAKLEASPDFLRFADEERVREAQLRLAQMRRRADIRGTVGLRRYEQGNDVAVVAGISVPLYSAGRAQAQIDAMRAERDHLQSDRDSVFLRTQAELFRAHQELIHASEVAGVVRDQLVPRLERALEQTEYAYEQGRYSYLQWSVAQQELLDARRRLIETATDFHTLQIEIERLTGESLERAGGTP